MSSITLICVDTIQHDLSHNAIEETLKNIDVKQVLIFSDKNFYSDANWIKIDKITRNEYSNFLIKDLYKYIETDFILVVQNDGMAVNKNAWTNYFFNYDYIGAPWPESNNINFSGVGNGGFSLRSKKLLYELQNDSIVYDPQKISKVGWDNYSEDYVICITYGNYLRNRNIKFADIPTAHTFSHEFEPAFTESFGFHGMFNVPHFFKTDSKIEEFLKLCTIRYSKQYTMMILELLKFNKLNLAKYALDLGRTNNVFNIFFPKNLSYINLLIKCLDINFFYYNNFMELVNKFDD
jgi:hypothetical protein